MNAASPAPAAQPIPVFDLHCDTADRLSWQSLSGSLRKAAGMHFYGPGDEADPAGCRQLARNHGAISVEKVGVTPWAQCFACFVPDELSPEEAVAFEAHVSAYLADQVAACAELGAVAVTRASQIRPLLEGAPAGEKDARLEAVRTIENARLFATDLGLVERLARQGLLMASLSWNAAGPLASGHDTHEGLSATGAAALAEMERCGVVMDVSHLNDECFADVAARARRPFVASHSNSRAVCGHLRNLTDDQFRCIRDAGGVVGLNYCTRFLVDGACGEGPNGKKQVYDFDGYFELIHKYQPNATVFNDRGPVRWCGNEDGSSRHAEWAVVPSELCPNCEIQTEPGPFAGDLSYMYNMDENIGSLSNIIYSRGLVFAPSEVDMSIRPGWFYHENEEPYSLDRLFDTYLRSVGGNTTFILNIPPKPDGTFDEKDVVRLKELGEKIRESFSVNLAEGKVGKMEPYKNSDTQCTVEIDLKKEETIHFVEISEDIARGQRIENFFVQRYKDNRWENCFEGTTVGARKIVCFDEGLIADRLRIFVTAARDMPEFKRIAIY